MVWFEIPVKNLDRAIEFYQRVFGISLVRTEIDGHPMALFPELSEGAGSSGALAQGDSYEPSLDGPRVYFSVESAQATFDLAISAGATTLYPVTEVSPGTRVAEFSDSEGNRVAIIQND